MTEQSAAFTRPVSATHGAMTLTVPYLPTQRTESSPPPTLARQPPVRLAPPLDHLHPVERLSDTLLEAAFAASSTPTCLIDCSEDEPRIRRANAAYVRLTGWSAVELAGANPLSITGDDADAGALDVLRKALATGAGARVSTVASRRGGPAYWCEITVLPVRDLTRAVVGAVMEHRDLSRELAAEARGWRGHHVDPTTGLAARSLVDAETTRLCTGAMSFALLSCALTGLDAVNSQEGESAGDDLLTTAGRRIAELVGTQGRVGRHTGASYAVIMEGAGRVECDALAAAIEQSFLERPLRADVGIGITVGGAVFPEDARSAAALQHAAIRQREEVRRLAVSKWARARWRTGH